MFKFIILRSLEKSMPWPLIETILGIALLYVGGEWLVRSTVRLALHFGIRPVIAGMTVAAYSTSIPELITTMFALAETGGGNIPLGIILGSDLVNIGALLGLTALLRPLCFHSELRKADLPILLLATLFPGALIYDGSISRWEGVFLMCSFIPIVAYQIYTARRGADAESLQKPAASVGKEIFFILLSVACLSLGAKWLIDGAVVIARWAGISERAISLSLVSFGTSLPELTTSIIAVLRGHPGIVLGNIIGSNLFANLFLLGLAGIVRPFSFSPDFFFLDFSTLIGFTLLLWAILGFTSKLNRSFGAIFFFGYLAYLWFFVFKMGAA